MLLFWLLCLACFLSPSNCSEEGNETRYHVAKLDWPHVEAPFTILLWILLASIAKIGFHLSKKFASIFPDSSLLIVLGLSVGLLLYLANAKERAFNLGSEIFFLFLLPPIVFDAGYFMPNRSFFDNLGTILVYAVFGTLWNMLTIGLSLWAVSNTGAFSMETPLLHLLLFSSLISAVDPVAVLVVFEEIHVNEVLFIVVFGESLLNDAVTVVLYHMFETFAEIGEDKISTQDIVLGFVSFFVVGLGGVVIGLVWAVVASFTTRWTKHVRVLEPLFVFVMAYCSYLTAELFHLSGILAIVFCGIAMKQYVEGNVSQKSQTTIKYFLKMWSSSSETIIFMFLGLSTVSTSHHWDTAFVGLTVLFCLVYRAIGVVAQTFFINKLRISKLNKVDQFIMAYGGLRGAIAYGLVVALDEEVIHAKQMFVTACIVVIYFTVFLQGMTIKPLVNFLKVKKHEKRQKTMNEQIFERFLDHTLAGLEDIASQRGHHWLRDKYEHYNTRYLKPLLMRKAPKTRDAGLIAAYTKISMKEIKQTMNRMHTMGSFPSFQASPSRSSLSQSQAESESVEMGAYSNPCFDLNSLNPIWSEKIESESAFHRLSQVPEGIQDKQPERQRLSSTHSEPTSGGSLGNQKPVLSDADLDLDAGRAKKVSFEVGGRQLQSPDSYYVNFETEPEKNSRSSTELEPRGETALTLAEKELPWTRTSENGKQIPENDVSADNENLVPDATQADDSGLNEQNVVANTESLATTEDAVDPKETPPNSFLSSPVPPRSSEETVLPLGLEDVQLTPQHFV